MNIVGLSAFSHDSACCLLQDGRLVAAAQEERFSRIKGDPGLPIRAFRSCLRAGDIGVDQIDAVAYYELPELRRQRQRAQGLRPQLEIDPELEIRERLGFRGKIDCYPHHRSHAASAFFFSPFDSAAILTADGVGEWTTTAWATGSGCRLEICEELRFPHSLGLFYSTITAWLGFPVLRGEGTVMGLAAHGQPRFLDELRRLLESTGDGRFRLRQEYFSFTDTMFSPLLGELLPVPARRPLEPVEPRHADLAASAQALLEEVLLEMVEHLQRITGETRLCLAGGVALNCSANGRIARDSGFQRIWVQPAAGDAGGALGAAALAHVERCGSRPEPLRDVFLGPSFDPLESLQSTPLDFEDLRSRGDELAQRAVAHLEAGKLLGWLEGRMEWGPRALGARSILADPRSPRTRDLLNSEIKQREPFRPFAASVLEEHVGTVLDSTGLERIADPGMMHFACSTVGRPSAIRHVDGSTRPQVVGCQAPPGFRALLEAWHRRTGCAMLLNTSFNGRGEPIVCSPADALFTFVATGLDALILDGCWIESVPERWRRLLPAWRPPSAPCQRDLYSF